MQPRHIISLVCIAVHVLSPDKLQEIGVTHGYCDRLSTFQTRNEMAILSNMFGSTRYMSFLQSLGQLLRLSDCNPLSTYLGGLDNRGTDGQFAYAWHADFMQGETSFLLWLRYLCRKCCLFANDGISIITVYKDVVINRQSVVMVLQKYLFNCQLMMLNKLGWILNSPSWYSSLFSAFWRFVLIDKVSEMDGQYTETFQERCRILFGASYHKELAKNNIWIADYREVNRK